MNNRTFTMNTMRRMLPVWVGACLGLWLALRSFSEGGEQGVRVVPARAPPEMADRVIPPSPVGYGGQAEPWLDDPFPDCDTEPVMAYANG